MAMKLVKTVKCKLEVSQEETSTLKETLSRFAAACNDVLRVALEHKTSNKVKLQHLCYHGLKARYQLQANLVIRAIARVAEASKRRQKPQSFRPTSLALDARTFSFMEPKEMVSISTHAGRLKLKLSLGHFQRSLLKGQRPTSACLYWAQRTGSFYINIVLKKEVALPSGSEAVGCDRGIYNLATTSNGLKFSGKKVKHIRNHYCRLRQSLQAKGTKGAKRVLKRLSGKEKRWMAWVNHSISRKIVDSCNSGDVLVLEDLKCIRERIKVARKERSLHHSWAFGQLGFFLQYKALERGIPLVYVNPRHTSQRCPRCAHIESSNRNGHRFSCRICGYTGHADQVAAYNIAEVFRTLGDGVPVNAPFNQRPARAVES